ncbi:MAG: deoxyribose-phosphate aldolase [Geminocystis sp.]|nr:deoxyribose-phosphate aldolase [Geminocystis sp.]HIK38566.1 deoxyribose-phosphate aldolase [Geminocystis sp. M7585_C2015_104]
MGREEINIAEYIDLAILQPTATREDVRRGCEIAIRYNFPAVCVYPQAVKLARELLHRQKTIVSTVIGFPTGNTTPGCKLYEAQEAAENGSEELEVVINLGWAKEGKWDSIHEEIATIVEETGKRVKAILETNLLTVEEKKMAAEVCLEAGVAFLKTNTGWFGGANVEDVRLLAEIVGGAVGIKAAGGIRELGQALALIQAGATRLGTSRGLELVKQQQLLDQ